MFELIESTPEAPEPGRQQAKPNLDPLSALQRGTTRDGKSEIYVIKADGTRAARRLTRNQKTDSAPAWSPNGRKIAFQRQWDETDLSGRIWTMLRDGTIQRVRTPRSSDAKQPDWQPLPLL